MGRQTWVCLRISWEWRKARHFPEVSRIASPPLARGTGMGYLGRVAPRPAGLAHQSFLPE
jgi:hypothetical protein